MNLDASPISFYSQNQDEQTTKSQGLDAMLDAKTIIPGELSEAFARLDPDLSFLHGEMMTAMGKLDHLRRSGADVLAIQYALDHYESMKSVYQTRLIEVRESKLLTQSELSADEKDEKRVLHELSMQDRMNENFARLRDQRARDKKKKEQQKQDQGSWFLYFAIGLMVAQMNARRYENQHENTVSQRFSSGGHQSE